MGLTLTLRRKEADAETRDSPHSQCAGVAEVIEQRSQSRRRGAAVFPTQELELGLGDGEVFAVRPDGRTRRLGAVLGEVVRQCDDLPPAISWRGEDRRSLVKRTSGSMLGMRTSNSPNSLLNVQIEGGGLAHHAPKKLVGARKARCGPLAVDSLRQTA